MRPKVRLKYFVYECSFSRFSRHWLRLRSIRYLTNVKKIEPTPSDFFMLLKIIVGSNRGKWQFSQPAAAQRAAKCLGTTVEELSHLIFNQIVLTSTNHGRTSFSNPSSTDPIKAHVNDNLSGVDALEGFIVGLYVELFNLVGSYVNRLISSLFFQLFLLTAIYSALVSNDLLISDVYRPMPRPLIRF